MSPLHSKAKTRDLEKKNVRGCNTGVGQMPAPAVIVGCVPKNTEMSTINLLTGSLERIAFTSPSDTRKDQRE